MPLPATDTLPEKRSKRPGTKRRKTASERGPRLIVLSLGNGGGVVECQLESSKHKTVTFTFRIQDVVPQDIATNLVSGIMRAHCAGFWETKWPSLKNAFLISVPYSVPTIWAMQNTHFVAVALVLFYIEELIKCTNAVIWWQHIHCHAHYLFRNGLSGWSCVCVCGAPVFTLWSSFLSPT